MKSLPVFRLAFVALAAVTATATLGTTARAQGARTVYLWDAGGTNSSTVGAWGGGAAQMGRDMGLDGGRFLTITTHNFYEGARFDFKTPLDLAPYKQTGFWRMRIRLRNPGPMQMNPDGMPGFAGWPGGEGMMPGMPGGEMGDAPMDGMDGTDITMNADPRMTPFVTTAPQFGPMPQVGGPGAQAGAFPPGGMPEEGGFAGRRRSRMRTRDTGLSQIQLIVLLDKGAMFGRVSVNSRARVDASGWQTVLVPLRDMRPTADASGLARRVILTGDKDAAFALEQIALAVETSRIVASVRTAREAPGAQISEVTVQPGRSTTLVADVEAGSSDVDVIWNFDADNSGSYPPPAGMADPSMAQPGEMPPGMIPGMMPGQDPGMAGAMMGENGEGMMPVAGPRIDARGLTARPDWPNEEQNYRVEITVRDRAGRKGDVKASLIVKVRSNE